MASTLSASAIGLEIVDRARQKKDWTKAEVAWQVRADVSKSSLDRFWMQKPIKRQNFKAICTAVGVDWEQVIDELPEIEPTNINITRKSNLAQGNQPVILELEEFGQQIFDWFGALDFKFEGLPRQEGKYVEWVIQVPVRRSRFDRVLIRATIHEAGLSDLDSLRRGVAQLRVDEGWLVTNLWVSQSVRQALIKSDDDNLTCLTFDELIDQDADFTPYLDWLEREISKREIDRYYVDLGCTKGEFDADTRSLRGTSKYSVADGGIDRYIDRWLENPVTEHVSILGEFGTGKTWFAFHYAGKCLQAYRDAKSKGMPRPRLPLVIPLRDYAKALDVENVFAGFFYTQHNIRLNSEVFDRLNQMGKLLLIFDGFDEMADKIDTQKMTDNFWELAKVVTTNAKVILTCRTEHFPTAQDGRENFGGERIPSNANKIAVAPKFETLELMKFDDEQIRAVLSRRTNSATVELVMANSQLLDLLRRAVMAEFVLEALPEIEAGKPIDLARVYLYAVRHKMERDITTGRTFTSLADKLYFLCELAWEMLSEDKMSLNYREFPDRLRVLFKNEVKEQKHLDHWHYDMMGQTMLIRNDDGDYSPAHRSLLEFFVTYKLAAELGLLAADFLEMAKKQSRIDESLKPHFYTWSDYWRRELDDKGERKLIAPLAGFKSESPEKLRDTFGKKPLSKAILDLLLPSLNLEVKDRKSNRLLNLIKSTKAADVGYSGGNAATILVKINLNALESQDLNDTNLAHADLVGAGLRKTNLSGANLENCLTTKVFGSVNAIIISNDNRYLLTAHEDSAIIIWDRDSGVEQQKLIENHSRVNCLVLSADNQSLYSGSGDGIIKEWKLTDGIYKISPCTFEKCSDSINHFALSTDGKLLYSGSDDHTIKKWKLADGSCQDTFEGHKGSVRAISIDGEFLYSGSDDHTIKKWKLADGTCQGTFEGHKGSVRAIVISLDGRFLYSGSDDRTIKKWKLTDGICQDTFEGHKNWVRAITISSDGQVLYSGDEDGIIKVWKVVDRSCQYTLKSHESWINTILLSTDGQLLYSGSNDLTIKEWKVDDKSCQRTFNSHKNLIRTIALSPDEYFLYSGSHDRAIKKWQIADHSDKQTFKGHDGWVRAIVISLDGEFLYSGSDDHTIKKWKLADGSCQGTFEGHKGSVRAVSMDGEFLYSGSDDHTIKKWKLADGSCQGTFEGHKGSVRAISIDGEFLYSGSDDHTIKKWKLADGSCQCTFEGHGGSVNTIALSSDGQFLYSGSNDYTIKKWRVDNKNCQDTFEEHENYVNEIVLNSDGQFLYSGSDDRMIKTWEVETGKCINTIDPRLCSGAKIMGANGLTNAQKKDLISLGAKDR
jgi:predicted NACHT family NTPase